MAAANGSAVKYYYVVEVAGAIPAVAPDFKPIRFTGSSLNVNTAQVDSAELGQRQKPVAKQGTYSIAGDISGELSHGTFDDLIAAALQGTWATNTLKVGSTVQSIAILKRHTDSGDDYVYRGCRINTMALSAAPDARVAVTFGVVGTEAEVYTVPGDATFATATTTDPMVTSVGALSEGGLALATVTGFEMTLDNGMEPMHVLFQRPAYDVQNGQLTVSGSLSAYRADGDLYAKFLNETATDIAVTFSDGTNTLQFTLPDVIYTQADDPVSGPGAIINQLTYSAGYDATAATTLTVTRSA